MDELWEDRAALWASAPPVPAGGDAILEHYFRQRRAQFPASPCVHPGAVARILLHAGGSAPGLEGVPYELLQHGVAFISHLIVQAHYIAQLYPHMLSITLGPSTDLLAWIPKSGGEASAESV